MPKTKNSELTNTVLSYLEQYASLPSLTLAKLINKDNPQFTVDSLRCSIRYYRQASGGPQRDICSRNHGDKYVIENVAPIADNVEYTPFIIPETSVGILSDIHIPFHDPEAVNAAVSYLKRKGVQSILLNGDIIDMYSMSKFLTDPMVWARGLQHEIDRLSHFLDELNITFPDAPIYYKIGNHEERLKHWIWRNRDLHGLKALDFENLINAKDFNVQIIEDRRIIKIGGLNVLHGHELNGTSPVNPARGVYNATKASVMIGHQHRTSEHTETGLDSWVTTWSLGCLCYLHPPYAVINKWNHGFGYVRNDGEYFKASTLRIHKGVVL